MTGERPPAAPAGRRAVLDPPAARVTTTREVRRPPSAAIFMVRAMLPRPWRARGAAPAVPPLRWAPARLDRRALADYLHLTDQHAGDRLPLGWPQVWGFRLQMALLTDRRFPLPIWSALQVRNRLLQRAPLPVDARYALGVRVAGQRRLDRGVEVDLHSTLHADGALAWEGLTTFYWRGRHGGGPADAPSPLAASPAVRGDVIARWSSGRGAGWRFGALTGDYNGLHWSDAYARAFGFRHAFHHPPRAAGQCLSRLDLPAGAIGQRLDLWIKGPVLYRSELALRSERAGDGRLFALLVGDDPRPALVGRWAPVGPDAALDDASAAGA